MRSVSSEISPALTSSLCTYPAPSRISFSLRCFSSLHPYEGGMANDTKKDALSSAAARASTRNGGRNGSCPVPAPHRPSLRPVTVAQTCSARPSGPPGAGRPLSAGASFPFRFLWMRHPLRQGTRASATSARSWFHYAAGRPNCQAFPAAQPPFPRSFPGKGAAPAICQGFV